MSLERIEDLHRELDFARFEPSLRQIKGVWSAIRNARLAASRDPRKLKAYKDILVRAIERSKKSEVVSDEAAEQLGNELREYGEQLCQTHKVSERLTGRLPGETYAWMRKHFPEVTTRTDEVLEAFYKGPSTESLQLAKDAVREFYEVFSGVGRK